jgi:hypothetical protein
LEPVFGGSATKGNRVFGKNRSIEGVQSGAKKPSKCSRSQPTVSEPTAVAEDASMAMDELRVPQTTPTQELDAEQPVDAEMLAADSAATGRGRSKSKSKKPSAAPAQVERESSRSRQAASVSSEAEKRSEPSAVAEDASRLRTLVSRASVMSMQRLRRARRRPARSSEASR